jgi:hypothetical protein
MQYIWICFITTSFSKYTCNPYDSSPIKACNSYMLQWATTSGGQDPKATNQFRGTRPLLRSSIITLHCRFVQVLFYHTVLDTPVTVFSKHQQHGVEVAPWIGRQGSECPSGNRQLHCPSSFDQHCSHCSLDPQERLTPVSYTHLTLPTN